MSKINIPDPLTVCTHEIPPNDEDASSVGRLLVVARPAVSPVPRKLWIRSLQTMVYAPARGKVQRNH